MCKTNLKSIFTVVVPLAFAALSVAPAAHAGDQVAMLDVLSVSAPSRASEARSAKVYEEAMQKRAAGDDMGAFLAFQEAAKAGNAKAQRRLGEIYDGKTAVVERDYVKALKWYQLARLQGEDIPAPLRHSISATGFIR